MSKEIARKIYDAALESVLPENFMREKCSLDGDVLSVDASKYDLSLYKNIYVFGSGKAAYTMAKEIERLIVNKIHKGLIISPFDEHELEKIRVKIGAHPIPDNNSIEATKALLKMMSECTKDDLYIFLLSGGSSALMELLIQPISIDELQVATKLMLSEDLKIQDINTVRKHLSAIKGGALAKKCKARGVVLVLSDVIDDSLESIGSAPLYMDNSSFEDAQKILKDKNLLLKMPKSIQKVIKDGVDKKIKDTAKKPLERVSHHILASNELAKQSAKTSASELGLSVELVCESMQGEVTQMLEKILRITDASKKNCIILGGECTVDLNGAGQGGRNQHLALLILKKILDKNLNITFLSASTDGVDGNSDATGAVVDAQCKASLSEIQRYITNFDSYSFFKQTDCLIVKGKTGTNVMDIVIILKGVENG
jgi:hydroxypyruvate reductase/glycerate 2-kinase